MKLSFLLTVLSASLVAAAPISTGPVDHNEKRNTPLNTILTIILNHLPAVNGAIGAVESVITNFQELVSNLTGISDTYNELGGACTDYTVIFARGTDDPGNTGVITGPPFFMALQSLVGSSKVTIQGVNNYAASVATFLAGGDPVGSASMASEIQAAHAACPNTHLVASGYSQGGQVVHNALALLPAATASWISSVVIFGDPLDGQAIPNVAASKVDTVCHTGDNICQAGDIILPAHLTYGENAAAAAAFVVAAAK
ncbi:47f13803-3151-427c-b2f4-d414fc5b49a4 [Sclerotinia trifoliorum]|uniref:Cutinase n=1 Tax=Sclerotinia trifoliorum TaxID=28548 RepID=A0A8H2VZT2_9HELO|nr:47f13803-3151-427c-b2f4-d414fc5b49a4 [Sclerotinia trifoliorum]